MAQLKQFRPLCAPDKFLQYNIVHFIPLAFPHPICSARLPLRIALIRERKSEFDIGGYVLGYLDTWLPWLLHSTLLSLTRYRTISIYTAICNYCCYCTGKDTLLYLRDPARVEGSKVSILISYYRLQRYLHYVSSHLIHNFLIHILIDLRPRAIYHMFITLLNLGLLTYLFPRSLRLST